MADDAGVIGLVFSQFMRLTAGTAIATVAAIKLYRFGIEEIRKAIKEIETKAKDTRWAEVHGLIIKNNADNLFCDRKKLCLN